MGQEATIPLSTHLFSTEKAPESHLPSKSTNLYIPLSASEGADGVCHVDLVVSPGESCTYPGTSDEFSVGSSGTGRFLFFTAGTGIDAHNTTINGVRYNFKASKQGDGTWIIEAAGGFVSRRRTRVHNHRNARTHTITATSGAGC